MAYARINIRQELRRVAKGKPTKVPVEILAELVLSAWSAMAEIEAPKSDEVRWLENLHRLGDKRTA